MESETHIVYVDGDGRDSVADELRAISDRLTVVRTVAGCFAHLSSATCIVATDGLADADPVALCSRIDDYRPFVPVVVFPADGSESLAGDVIAAGADGYVPQSDGVETLLTRVRTLIDETPATLAAGTSTDRATDRNGDSSAASSRISTATSAASVSPPDAEAVSSDRFEHLVSRAPFAVVEWTPDFEVQTWNAAAEELFGYTATQAHGENGLELVVPDETRAVVRDHWDALTSTDSEISPAWRVNANVRRDGSTITCEWFHAPIVDDDGDLGSVLSFVQDVTAERKRANALEALQETTAELMRAESTDEIASIVIEATEHVLDQPLAALRFADDDRDVLELAAGTEALATATGDIDAVGPDDGLLWDVYTRGEPTVINDISPDRLPYDIDIEVGSVVCYPLEGHGLLSVATADGNRLDTAEINLVHVLAATTEAALDRATRERELERTKTIVETVGDGVYALDCDGTLLAVNDRLAEMTGYDQDELVGEHASRILTDESVARGEKRVRALASADEEFVATYEVTLTTSAGDRFPCEINATLLRDDGVLDGSVGIVRDVSDRKRMERELVERKAKIESLHDVASRLDDFETPAAICDCAVEAAEDVLDFDVCAIDTLEDGAFVKMALSSTLEDDFDRRVSVDEGIVGRTYRTGETQRIADVRNDPDAIAQDETFRSVLSVPIGDWGVFQTVSTEVGAFTREDEELAELLLSHVTDALDRIAFAEQIRTERDRFAALFENVPDAVVSTKHTDDAAIVESVNSSFERVFGYDESTIAGEPLDQFIVPTDERNEAETITQRGGDGEIVEAEVKRRTVDGLREFMMRVVPVERGESAGHAFGLYTDITDQKQRQKRVEILNRVLRHDMRNGMNIIDGYAQMLAEAVDGEDAEYAAAIQERAEELISLAEKTRAVERVLERESATAGPIDLSAAVSSSIDRLRETNPEHEVEFDRSLPDNLFVRADATLRTALYQVLKNAVEHTDRETPTIEISVHDGGDGMVALSIADDGPGMPKEERELLQGDREITQLRHASGLGLWLVILVVTQSGGQLRFDANEPRGTVVTLELPRADTRLADSVADTTATGD